MRRSIAIIILLILPRCGDSHLEYPCQWDGVGLDVATRVPEGQRCDPACDSCGDDLTCGLINETCIDRQACEGDTDCEPEQPRCDVDAGVCTLACSSDLPCSLDEPGAVCCDGQCRLPSLRTTPEGHSWPLCDQRSGSPQMEPIALAKTEVTPAWSNVSHGDAPLPCPGDTGDDMNWRTTGSVDLEGVVCVPLVDSYSGCDRDCAGEMPACPLTHQGRLVCATDATDCRNCLPCKAIWANLGGGGCIPAFTFYIPVELGPCGESTGIAIRRESEGAAPTPGCAGGIGGPWSCPEEEPRCPSGSPHCPALLDGHVMCPPDQCGSGCLSCTAEWQLQDRGCVAVYTYYL